MKIRDMERTEGATKKSMIREWWLNTVSFIYYFMEEPNSIFLHFKNGLFHGYKHK